MHHMIQRRDQNMWSFRPEQNSIYIFEKTEQKQSVVVDHNLIGWSANSDGTKTVLGQKLDSLVRISVIQYKTQLLSFLLKYETFDLKIMFSSFHHIKYISVFFFNLSLVLSDLEGPLQSGRPGPLPNRSSGLAYVAPPTLVFHLHE